jgi:hypothetical protein
MLHVALARRGLAALALAAVAPGAEARRRKKRKKPPVTSPPPLAVVTIAIQDVVVHQNGQGFVWGYDAQVRHVSGKTVDLTDTVTGTALDTSQEATRAAIMSGARSLARTFLLNQGEDVPEDRIAAIML